LKANPQDWISMKTLGMAYLLISQPLDAYLTFSTGMVIAPPESGLSGFRNLALRLLAGDRIATANLDGQILKFHLRLDDGQMMEAALYHIHGGLTEPEELRLIRNKIKSSETLVEVGTLVGNHLVYFLKILQPKRAIIFDISARNIEACRDNVRLNEPYATSPELVFKPIGISRASGTKTGPDGKLADVTSLDEAVSDRVDFIKIDIDGGEIDALQGSRRLISQFRPRIMIEINRENEEPFRSLLGEMKYEIAGQVDHGLYKNYLIQSR